MEWPDTVMFQGNYSQTQYTTHRGSNTYISDTYPPQSHFSHWGGKGDVPPMMAKCFTIPPRGLLTSVVISSTGAADAPSSENSTTMAPSSLVSTLTSWTAAAAAEVSPGVASIISPGWSDAGGSFGALGTGAMLTSTVLSDGATAGAIAGMTASIGGTIKVCSSIDGLSGPGSAAATGAGATAFGAC